MYARLLPLLTFLIILSLGAATTALGKTERPDDRSDVIKTTEWVATMLMNREFDDLHQEFSATLQVSLSIEKIEEVMDQVERQIGTIESVGSARTRTLRGTPAGEVICRAEMGRLVVQVMFDGEEIEGLWVVPGK